ncbi:MAG: WD40 repeat domain-containing protein [Flavobacteriales bacterium]|nr:WD40 repeat domain-containing protein [Flavobacteriales bacterium]
MFAPPIARTGHRSAIYALAPLTGPGFLSGSGDGQVVEWPADPASAGHVIAEAGQSVFSLLLLPDGRRVLIGTGQGDLVLIDRSERKVVARMTMHRAGIFSIVRLRDTHILTAGGDGTLGLWQLANDQLQLVRAIPLTGSKLRALALAPQGDLMAVACGDGTVRVLETDLLNELHTIQAHDKGSTALTWHPGKPVLLSGGKDGHVRAWHQHEGFRSVHAWPAHQGTIYAIAFAPDRDLFATASRDRQVKLWDARTTEALARADRTAGGHMHSVNALLWRGGTLLSAGDDKRVLAWPVG